MALPTIFFDENGFTIPKTLIQTPHSPPPAPPPTCPTTYRIKSPAETGDVVLDRAQLTFAGVSGVEMAGTGYVGFATDDGRGGYGFMATFAVDSHLLVREEHHQFPNWGTRRVRCDCCDVWGTFDAATGQYRATD